MARMNKKKVSNPVCVFCGGTGAGVQFAMFTPRFKPFGTACVKCEETLPEGTTIPEGTHANANPASLHES